MLKLKENNSLIEIDINNVYSLKKPIPFLMHAFLYKDVLFLIKEVYFNIYLQKDDKGTYLYKYIDLYWYRKYKYNTKLPYNYYGKVLVLNAHNYTRKNFSKIYNITFLSTLLDNNYFNAIDDIIIKLGEKQFIFIDYTKNYFNEYVKTIDDIFVYYDEYSHNDYLLLNGAVYEVEAK